MKPHHPKHRSPARYLGRVIEGAAAAPFPGFVEPCCPVERKHPPSREQWLHEIKHDGYRAQAHCQEGAVNVFTRRGHDWAARMPTIAASVKALPSTTWFPTESLQLIKYVDHIEGNGKAALQHECKLKLEGIVSKRTDHVYRSAIVPTGSRQSGPAWREANRDRFEKLKGR